MQLENWLLTIEFREHEDNVFPDDYVSRSVAFICEHWGLLTEDIDDLMEFNGNTFKVTTDTLDSLQEYLNWITMNLLFDSLTLKVTD